MPIPLPQRTSVTRDKIRDASLVGLARSVGDSTVSDYTYAFSHHKDVVKRLIVERNLRVVCEIGGGRSPLFTPEEVDELRLDYTVLDISRDELARTSARYARVVGDICNLHIDADCEESYDLVFSQMLAEHVSSGEAMHRNVLRLLRPGGIAFHFFPTLFSPAFVANRLFPERVAHWILRTTHRGREGHEKFPAKYSWCYGPSPRRVQKLTALGYIVMDYRSFYGTAYLRFFPLARQLEAGFHKIAAKRRSRLFSSYVWLFLLKPGET